MKVSRVIPRFLTVDEVVDLHRKSIREFGGSMGIREPSLLDSAVHSPQATYGGEDLYSGLLGKAAVYLVHIAANHPFVDGNKRTAWVSCRVFLNLNGIRVKPRWKEIVEVVEKVGSGEIRDWKSISEWLAKYAAEF